MKSVFRCVIIKMNIYFEFYRFMEKIIMLFKLGVIGVGVIGKEYICCCIQVLQGVIVVVVFDINVDNVCVVVVLLGVQVEVYVDGYDVINVSDVDVILVIFWDLIYEEYILVVIVVGKLVFCEKLLVMFVEGCCCIVDVEMKVGCCLVQVGFMCLYDEGYLVLKKVIDDGDIGVLLMLCCVYCNQLVGENYIIDMVIINILIYELDVLCWLLNDDYCFVQVCFLCFILYIYVCLKDLQIVFFEIKKGILIDVEVFVNCQYGYDIQCEVVGEIGIVCLLELFVVQMCKFVSLLIVIFIDWKDCFIKVYDVELQVFINDVKVGQLYGLLVWDGYVVLVVVDVCIKVQGISELVEVMLFECLVFYKC